MKQLSLAAHDFVKKPKQTRREKSLIEMEAEKSIDRHAWNSWYPRPPPPEQSSGMHTPRRVDG